MLDILSTANFNSNIYSYNQATNLGGAIAIQQSSNPIYFTNETISSNQALLEGGGIYILEITANVSFSDSYFTDNSA
jgi:predicted outer membrane repeat protein